MIPYLVYLCLVQKHIVNFNYCKNINVKYFCRYCKAEANTAFRKDIPIVACCMEAGYEADRWLAVVISAAPGLDCSTDAKLAASLDRLEKELRAARRVIKPEYSFIPLASVVNHLGSLIASILNAPQSTVDR